MAACTWSSQVGSVMHAEVCGARGVAELVLATEAAGSLAVMTGRSLMRTMQARQATCRHMASVGGEAFKLF